MSLISTNNNSMFSHISFALKIPHIAAECALPTYNNAFPSKI